jgi:UDP-GlcNAc:undecaprenyl-phosphate GlcNAc-1-phosphate transferase
MIMASRKWNIMDIPNERKAHKQPIPLMGGVAIYLATFIATILYFFIFDDKSLQLNIIIAYLIGISGVSMMGLIDDILSLSPKRRLVVLFILALIVLVGCLQFYFPPTLLHDPLLAIVTSVIVVFWIVAITNATNFTDGLDGLASCLSLVSAVSFAVIFYIQGRYQLALPTTLALCGAIFGFLTYNFHPAKIFMGDAGSMFIGFMLGILSIMSMSQKTIIVFVVPIFLMIVPIADMCMSVLRRLLLQMPVMKPDKMHFHHILIDRFKNHRVSVLILMGVQVVFASIGVLIYFLELYILGWIILAVLALLAIVYTMLKVKKIKSESQTELL